MLPAVFDRALERFGPRRISLSTQFGRRRGRVRSLLPEEDGRSLRPTFWPRASPDPPVVNRRCGVRQRRIVMIGSIYGR